jgi:hypothetical protein
MSRQSWLKIASALSVVFLLAGFAAALGPQSAAAASAYYYKGKRTAPVVHRGYYGYAASRRPRVTYPATLPYGPEYGFLHHVPPNAIAMPGYTFVPGLGILGESCDLPTSACTNQYRDVK